jgi:hypothetical protein
MNEDLRKWFKEKWKDISRKDKSGKHPPCGASADKGVRAKDSSRKYPKCVPANKAKNMSKKEKQSAVRRKRRAPNEPGSPDNVKTDVKKENWEKWHPSKKEVYPEGIPSNNAPENEKPMGGAVAFEKNRKEVLSHLQEVINDIVESILLETTVAPRRRQKVAASQTPSNIDINALKSILDKETRDNNDINNIIDYMRGKDINAFSSEFKSLSDKQIATLETVITQNVNPESKIYPELYNKIEFAAGQKHLAKLAAQEVPTTKGTPAQKKQTSKDVTKTVEILKSEEVRKAIEELMRKMKAAGYSSMDMSKRLADLGDFINTDFGPGAAASQIRGINLANLGAPQISPAEKNIFGKVKSFFGLNENETKQLMEKYEIHTEKDLDILIEAVAQLVLKEGK